MTCPVSETWAPGRATIPAGLYQMVLASSAAAAPPAKALPRALVLCVFIPNPPADRWVDRPTRPPPKIAFARIFVHSAIALPSGKIRLRFRPQSYTHFLRASTNGGGGSGRTG